MTDLFADDQYQQPDSYGGLCHDHLMAARDVEDVVDDARSMFASNVLTGSRLVVSADSSISRLRAAWKLAHEYQMLWEQKSSMPGNDEAKQLETAAEFQHVCDALSTAIELVLKSQPPPVDPPSSKVEVGFQVHTAEHTWYGELHLLTVPQIGSTIRLDGSSKVTVTDVEMDLAGKFTVHCEPPPAGAIPSRVLLTKVGLTSRRR